VDVSQTGPAGAPAQSLSLTQRMHSPGGVRQTGASAGQTASRVQVDETSGVGDASGPMSGATPSTAAASTGGLSSSDSSASCLPSESRASPGSTVATAASPSNDQLCAPQAPVASIRTRPRAARLTAAPREWP